MGVVSTGNSLDHVEADDKLMEANRADCKEMEAAAIAEVAEQFGVPFIGVKSVTDLVDSPVSTAEQFMANLAASATALQVALKKVLDFLDGKTVGDL